MRISDQGSNALSAAEGVAVRTASGSYRAIVGSQLLPTIGRRAVTLVSGRRCVIIADANTAPLYSRVIAQSLADQGFASTSITVPAGEGSKSLEQAGAICDEMEEAGVDRSSLIIAVGGGVVGDLAGFAASIYHRGIAYIQVPTTLLAQVDSSIGGKTGVNSAAGKNLLGSVHQPILVIADIDTLLTLPSRELRQGFAEIIKHALVADNSMFEQLEQFGQLSKSERRDGATSKLAPLIQRNIEIKAAIVGRDEHDTTGERAILNFGHTVGHAIECAAGYGTFSHGEAVSLGIAAACEISVRHARLSEQEKEMVIGALRAFDLPTQLPVDFPRDRIMPALLSDKKFDSGKVRFVVTSALGSARLTSDVTIAQIEEAIALL